MLENKDFWNDLLTGDEAASEDDGKKPSYPALNPGYRAEVKPTTTDPPVGSSELTIEAILADIRKTTGMEDAGIPPATKGVPRLRPKRVPTGSTDAHMADPDVPETNRSVTPPNTAPPGEANKTAVHPPGDNRQAMAEMTAAMRELTEELRYFRTQMEERPYDVAAYPRGKPPDEDSVADSVQDGHGDSDSPDTPNNKGKPETPKSTKDKVLSIVSNVLFYAVIVAMVVGAFLLRSTSEGKPFMLGPFSAANVLTGSMEDVYPRGSLIITRSVDPEELKIGDDITYMVSETTSITHRIIEITENYQSTGERGFRTKGVNNKEADKELVAAANVVGKVVFSSKFLGDLANFVKSNWPILIFVLIVIIALITFLKWNAKREEDDGDDNKPAKQPKPKKEKPQSHSKKRLKILSERSNEDNGNQ